MRNERMPLGIGAQLTAKTAADIDPVLRRDFEKIERTVAVRLRARRNVAVPGDKYYRVAAATA